mgnify:CR=1 FL=1
MNEKIDSILIIYLSGLFFMDKIIFLHTVAITDIWVSYSGFLYRR